ncbi:P2X purinoceptor 7 [Ctenopharyngodon idella]|uniref:P2X purinoceptor 7 n=1 Tax=Ctenopharyngodon idella TaxID=7959 RepID=UPI00222FB6A2|nr:P2X purinoceptor 7 [Ctenopharyngodon idella]
MSFLSVKRLRYCRCNCANCAVMPTERENICCMEIPQVSTRHMFLSTYINVNVKYIERITVFLFCRLLEGLTSNLSDFINVFHIRCYRHLAYRSFVSWCWGYLGRKIRVVIPSCVVLRICQEFPDAGGSCVGFRPPLD